MTHAVVIIMVHFLILPRLAVLRVITPWAQTVGTDIYARIF